MAATAQDSMHTRTSGMDRMSAGLWLALVAAMVQFSSVGSDFYNVGGTVRDAWFGIPHAADLIAISALATVVLAALTAADRSPARGRTVGLVIGLLGLAATAQLAYRMAVPPFGGCLTYNCGGTPKNPDVVLLAGIWIAVVACGLAALGGFMHAFSSRAERTLPNFWVAPEQTGTTPWLGTAAISALGMFVAGYTFFAFYTVPKGDGEAIWTAWLAVPHTATLVLLIALAIATLAYAASRNRSPLGPGAVGATIALLAFAATARTIYRIAVSPFYSGPAEGVFGEGVVINAPAYVAVALGVVTIVAGLLHGRTEPASVHTRDETLGDATTTSTTPPTTTT